MTPTVTVADNIAQLVTVTQQGAHVSIAQGTKVPATFRGIYIQNGKKHIRLH
jgi:hypothetical protein